MNYTYITQKLKIYLNNTINYFLQNWFICLKWFIISLFFVLLINIFLIQSFRVISGSMMPTLYEDDILFVSKWSYGYSRHSLPSILATWLPDTDKFLAFAKPQRGDVIVFTDKKLANVYVKRVIGIPGDRVQMINGQVWINGNELKQEMYSEQLIQNLRDNNIVLPRLNFLPTHITPDKIRLESMSQDLQYYTIDQMFSYLDNTDTFILSENNYFVMGDNRDNSTDSRIPKPRGLGLINLRYIIGKVRWLRRGILPQTWRSIDINHGK